jgi:hypothetical protein
VTDSLHRSPTLIVGETFSRDGGTLTCELGSSDGSYQVSLRSSLDGAAVEVFENAQQARQRHVAVVRQLHAAGWVARSPYED